MTGIEQDYRARRIALGITQERAARAAGISRRTLSAFENGEGGISLANLKRLCGAVGLEVTTREASSRPTLDELASEYDQPETPPARQRAGRKAK